MQYFKTVHHNVCNKTNLKIKEYDNGWYFYIDEKHLNTNEACAEWLKFNTGSLKDFKMTVNAILRNPNAMKY